MPFYWIMLCGCKNCFLALKDFWLFLTAVHWQGNPNTRENRTCGQQIGKLMCNLVAQVFSDTFPEKSHTLIIHNKAFHVLEIHIHFASPVLWKGPLSPAVPLPTMPGAPVQNSSLRSTFVPYW